VHPDDEYALKNENEFGKTEMWYIVDADEGASLVYGFKKDVTREEYRQAIENNTLMDILNKVPVHKGDVFFIPAGMVHAIGSGILIAEIQQNSNITYRVYDYGRVGADGKPRELHVDKAVEVSNLKGAAELDCKVKSEAKDGYAVAPLASCKYFNTERLDIDTCAFLNVCEKSFVSLLFLDGEGEIKFNGESYAFKKGESFFLPANMGEFSICGKSQVIVTRV
jgi:mannose-6-phosphate isomerase